MKRGSDLDTASAQPTKFPRLARLHWKYAYLPRVEALARHMSPALQESDRVLDVGCGSGILAKRLAETVPGLHIEGVDKHPRGQERIKVHRCDSRHLPFANDSYDVVILADVLHHDREPVAVLRECARVASRLVIVKDHLRHGWLSYLRICVLDRLANAPHQVPCLHTYWSLSEWNDLFERAGLKTSTIRTPIELYHWTLEPLFGGSLHLLAFTEPE